MFGSGPACDRRGLLLTLVRAEPADVGQDLVQAVTGDVLHGVVADAVVLAVVEDRDDIGVVQLGRRAGFVMEPPEVVGAGAEPWVHDLERHAAAERFPHRLVDHAHAPLADAAEDTVVAQPLGPWAGAVADGRRRSGRGIVGLGRAGGPCAGRGPARPRAAGLGGRAAHRAQLLDFDQRGEQLADLVGQRGVAPDVLGQRRPLSVAETRQERLQDRPQRVAAELGAPSDSGSCSRLFSRSFSSCVSLVLISRTPRHHQAGRSGSP